VAEGGGLLTPISISAIVVFARKSSRLNHFLDRATWLLLALAARFWELTGTILGTVQPPSGYPFMSNIDNIRNGV
jgi:hypothetical protein